MSLDYKYNEIVFNILNDKNTPSILTEINNKDFLNFISNNYNLISKLDTLTHGFIYYLFYKYNVQIKKDFFTNISNSNFFYIYHVYKNSLDFFELSEIKSILEEGNLQKNLKEFEISLNHNINVKIDGLINLDNCLFLKQLLDFGDINIFFENSAKQYIDTIISHNNNILDLPIILTHEDFFIEALKIEYVSTLVKKSLTSQNIFLDDFNVSDTLFLHIFTYLIDNESCNKDPALHNRIIDVLNDIVQRLLVKEHQLDYVQDEVSFILDISQKITFKYEKKHLSFIENFTNLLASKDSNFIKVFSLLNFNMTLEEKEFFIFSISFPIADSETLMTEPIFSQEKLIKYQDTIRQIIFNECLKNHLYPQKVFEILSSYYDVFDFKDKSTGINFNDAIYNSKFKDLILLSKEDYLRNFFSFNIDFIQKFHPSNIYFTKKFLKFLLLFKDYLFDKFQDFFNNQRHIHDLLNPFSFNFQIFNQNQTIDKIQSIVDYLKNYENEDDETEDSQVYISATNSINKFAQTTFILNEFSFYNILNNQFVTIDYSNYSFMLNSDFDIFNYLNINEYIEGGSIGVFTKSYFTSNKLRIQENLLTYFLYSISDIIKSKETINTPTSTVLQKLLPTPMSIEKLKKENLKHQSLNIENKNSLSLNSIFNILFEDKTLIQNSRIQRFLFVFYFNNFIFNFLEKNIQETISKEINIFIFKHYSFDHGYNFSQENIRVDFQQEYTTIADKRNRYIQFSYILSSPKFAAKFLLEKTNDISDIYPILPHSNLKYYNKYLIPLIKSFYLNIAALIDFKISKDSLFIYSDLFKVISKVLLMELFEINLKQFKQKDLEITNILNYLFNQNQNLVIHKFKIYPEISIYLKGIGYELLINDYEKNLYKQNVEKSVSIDKNNKTAFATKYQESFKQFFVLSLFMSDDDIVIDIIKTFFNNKNMRLLHHIYLSNSILLPVSPQIFSQKVLNNTFLYKDVQKYSDILIKSIFFDDTTQSFHKNISQETLKNFFYNFSEINFLVRYGFINQKLKLPNFVSTQLEDFFSLVIKGNIDNFSLNFNSFQIFKTYDIDCLKYKKFLLKNVPFIFLIETTDYASVHIDINKELFVTKEDIAIALRNIFNHNPYYSICLPKIFSYSKAFIKWVEFAHSQSDNKQKHLEETFKFLIKETIDIPEAQIFLLSYHISSVFFYLSINNYIKKGFDIARVSSCYKNSEIKSTYIENFKNNDPYSAANTHLFNYYLSLTYNLNEENFKNTLKHIDNKLNINDFNSNNSHKNYLINLMNVFIDSFTYREPSSLKNSFIFNLSFKDILFHFFSTEKNALFYICANPITYPHEKEYINNLPIDLDNSILYLKNFKEGSSAFEYKNEQFKVFFKTIEPLLQDNSISKNNIPNNLSSIEFILFQLHFENFFSDYDSQSLFNYLVTTDIPSSLSKELRSIQLLDNVNKNNNKNNDIIKKKI